MKRLWGGRGKRAGNSKRLLRSNRPPNAASASANWQSVRATARRLVASSRPPSPLNREIWNIKPRSPMRCAIAATSPAPRSFSPRCSLHEDLGYTYLALDENDKAIEQFKWVIDNQQLYPAETEEEREATARTIEGLRRTIDAVEPHWTAYGYTNLCLTGHYCERRTRNLESLLSSNQGGVELDYQPPDIGYVAGRTFQGFARTFFSYAPETVSPEGNSFQGGVGIHYKPLPDLNLVLSGERLIKFGANAINNWEGRISFSTSSGYEIDPFATQSRYSLLYLDFAATPQTPHQILTYADGREGINFTLADRMVVSPFVYGIFRGNYGVGANTSAETGIGASLRGFFNEDKYHAPQDAVELLPRLGYTVYDSLATPSVVFSITLVARF
jgi:hypothetical protein